MTLTFAEGENNSVTVNAENTDRPNVTILNRTSTELIVQVDGKRTPVAAGAKSFHEGAVTITPGAISFVAGKWTLGDKQ